MWNFEHEMKKKTKKNAEKGKFMKNFKDNFLNFFLVWSEMKKKKEAFQLQSTQILSFKSMKVWFWHEKIPRKSFEAFERKLKGNEKEISAKDAHPMKSSNSSPLNELLNTTNREKRAIVLCSRIFRVDWFGKISNNLNLLSMKNMKKKMKN